MKVENQKLKTVSVSYSYLLIQYAHRVYKSFMPNLSRFEYPQVCEYAV